ncbi:MAG: DUF2382 domain-containing protein [Chloroflexi bacterium]|nr:DUF2382 domain-containing protein [Chloroflexota bacterium]
MSGRRVSRAGHTPGEHGGETEPVHIQDTEILELHEEELVAHKETHELGEIQVRTEVESVPGRLEVDALREEVVVEHEPVGEVVSERVPAWEEDGVYVVPVYEERLVVSKRLVLRERIRIRRVGSTERQLFEETLRRERVVVDDPQQTGRVREVYPTDSAADEKPEEERDTSSGFLTGLVRKALE